MWIYSKPRNEHDLRFLLNLDLCSRINLSQLGERWFVEVMLGTEAVPIAATGSLEEAQEIVRRLFDAIRSGEQAYDVNEPAERRERVPTS